MKKDAKQFFVEEMAKIYRVKSVAKKTYKEHYKKVAEYNELYKKNEKLNEELKSLREDYFKPTLDNNKKK